MSKLLIPGIQARRALETDLRTGRAGWLVRVVLSLGAAAAMLAAAMLLIGLIEASGSARIHEEFIALIVGAAAALWCGVLAALWWSFRRFQVVLKSAFALMAIWAIVIPTAVLIESLLRRGADFLIAATVLSGFAVSFGSVALIGSAHRRVRDAHVLLRLEMRCPDCGYSLQGLSSCRCPECGAVYTIGELIGAMSGGRVVAGENADGNGNEGRNAGRNAGGDTDEGTDTGMDSARVSCS